MSSGWSFVARVAALQVPVHLLAATGYYLFLSRGAIEYRDAFGTVFWFWLTGPLPLFMLLPLGMAVPRTAIYERALGAAARGVECPEPERSAARRQLVGQADYSSTMALVQWLLNSGVLVAMLWWQNHESIERVLYALLGGFGVFAPLAAIGVHLATERAMRPYWPLLVPDGRPSEYVRQRQTLDGRMLIAFVLAGPVSALLMAAIGYVKGLDILTNSSQGYFHMQAMVGYTALALGATFFVALVFKQVLTSDLVDTLGRVTEALDRLARGERDVRVPVYSTDELGHLAERTNALAEALARRTETPQAPVELAAELPPEARDSSREALPAAPPRA